MSGYCLLYLAMMMVGSADSFSSQTRSTGGRLPICPDSPNCVSSQSSDPRHAIAPLGYRGTAEKARALLIKTVLGMKRSRIVNSGELYLHAEFTSAFFRFVDDVDLLFDDANKLIHVRSASRIGSFDFGVNRKRVEAIRTRFDALDKETN